MLQPQTAVPAHSPNVEVAHSIPGRIRLRFASADRDRVAAVAWKLSGHPSVIEVGWKPGGRSLIVRFDPAHDFDELLSILPSATFSPADEVQTPPQIDWSKIALSCLLSLVPLGPLGNVALAFVSSYAEQASGQPRSRDARGPRRVACPAAHRRMAVTGARRLVSNGA